jgi:aryl-alcohol dehydrogenase-like predicted oxidoreductase
VKEVCAQAAAWCREQGVDIAKLALQFAVSNTQIATILLGMASAEDVEKNIAWIEEPMDLQMVTAVRARLQPIADRTWELGRPENN